MCVIVGFVNYKKNLQNKNEILNNMLQTLSKRGPDEEGTYINNSVAFAHKRLIVIDPDRWKTAYDRKIFCRRICNNL